MISTHTHTVQLNHMEEISVLQRMIAVFRPIHTRLHRHQFATQEEFERNLEAFAQILVDGGCRVPVLES